MDYDPRKLRAVKRGVWWVLRGPHPSGFAERSAFVANKRNVYLAECEADAALVEEVHRTADAAEEARRRIVKGWVRAQ